MCKCARNYAGVRVFCSQMVRHFTSLHFTSLHFTSLHFTSLHFTSLHFTSLHFTSLHFTSLHFTSLHFTSLHPCPHMFISVRVCDMSDRCHSELGPLLRSGVRCAYLVSSITTTVTPDTRVCYLTICLSLLDCDWYTSVSAILTLVAELTVRSMATDRARDLDVVTTDPGPAGSSCR